MPDFDDLLSNQPQEVPPMPEPEFDKDAWAAQKKQQREELYALVDTTALDVAADPAQLTQYLEVQARFDRYSATNALLVLAQMPEATQLGDLDHWKKERVFIKPTEIGNAITILAPGKEYHRDDGSVGTGVDMKRVYDISQAERPRLQPIPKYDDRALVRALVNASPVPVEGVDQLGGPDALYSPEQGKILVQRGMDAPGIVSAVGREICRNEFGQQNADPALVDFTARAGAHLLCKRFNMEPQGIDLSDAPQHLGGMESKDLRGALSNIRALSNEIAARMAKELEPRKPEARS